MALHILIDNILIPIVQTALGEMFDNKIDKREPTYHFNLLYDLSHHLWDVFLSGIPYNVHSDHVYRPIVPTLI